MSQLASAGPPPGGEVGAGVVPPPDRDADNSRWLAALRSTGPRRDEAVERLQAMLVRAARFEVNRRRSGLPTVAARELDDLAGQAADDALVAVLARLDAFRGASRFTTWAYKFAIYETPSSCAGGPGRAARSRWTGSRGRPSRRSGWVRRRRRNPPSCSAPSGRESRPR